MEWPYRTIRRLEYANAETSALLRERDRQIERLDAELTLVRNDYRKLVDVATGRVTPRMSGALDLNRDPFAEDTNQPTTYVSDDEAIDVDALGDKLSGQAERSNAEGSATPEGTQGATE